MSRIIAVTGATGNIGSKVAESLIAKGVQVRVIGRDRAKLERFVSQGAEAFVGNLNDTDFLTQAFTGADGVFLMIPPNMRAEDALAHQSEIAEAEVNAIANAHVKQVVSLSSVGAHLPEHGGIVQGLHVFENLLNQLENVDVLHLRAAYFMENFLGMIPMIKMMGIHGSPLLGDLSLPVVATQDIAAAIVERLDQHDYSGKSVAYVLGTRDVTMQEATAILGKAIGKPDLPYIQFPYEDAKNALKGFGFSESFAAAMIRFQQSANEGLILNAHTRTPEDSTPTSLEQFAQTFASIYNA